MPLDKARERTRNVTLIGIAGPKGAGKSTLASQLVNEHDFVRASFADPMKRMIAVLGAPAGNLYGDDKVKALPLACLDGHSVRHALQTLGTEWGRECMGTDFWVNIAMREVAGVHRSRGVVFDDVRFENEAQAIKDRDGMIFRIAGSHEDLVDRHASERGIGLFDFEIQNDRKTTDMLAQVRKHLAAREMSL